MQPKSRVTAVVLAFFLGGFGVHKFYLGNPTAGIVYLLFCWTLIPAFIAFVEFIILLTMTDDVFNAKYNPGLALPAGAVATPGAARGRDHAAQLSDWAKLRESGAISDEEFEAKKRELLGA
ncbi:MAG: NINE protein [Chloroflexi bacterium CFX6]|nr:NINE protein [Chloroflexi bacterium CFX6]